MEIQTNELIDIWRQAPKKMNRHLNAIMFVTRYAFRWKHIFTRGKNLCRCYGVVASTCEWRRAPKNMVATSAARCRPCAGAPPPILPPVCAVSVGSTHANTSFANLRVRVVRAVEIYFSSVPKALP